MLLKPVIPDGNGLTVIVVVLMQPVAVSLYVITDVPPDTPVNTPVAEPIVATPVVPLIQVPPEVASLSVIVDPSHTAVLPVIVAGNGLTVTVVLVLQPVGNVYVITDVPVATPVTTPEEEPTVAIPVLPLVHVPPDEVLLNVVVDPTHTFVVPVMVAGNGFTVTVAIEYTVPQ